MPDCLCSEVGYFVRCRNCAVTPAEVRTLSDEDAALAEAYREWLDRPCGKPMHRGCRCVRELGHTGQCNCSYPGRIGLSRGDKAT